MNRQNLVWVVQPPRIRRGDPMTNSRYSGVIAVLLTMALASGCSPEGQDDPTPCNYTSKPVGTACDDRNPSTGNDTCVEGTCAGIVLPLDDPSTPGDDRAGWVTCADGSVCQDRCCLVSGLGLPWVCSTGGVCPGSQWGQSSCDGPEDCAQGQVCCPMSDDISCRSSCAVEALCHTDRDCPTGQVCSQRVEPWVQCTET